MGPIAGLGCRTGLPAQLPAEKPARSVLGSMDDQTPALVLLEHADAMKRLLKEELAHRDAVPACLQDTIEQLR